VRGVTRSLFVSGCEGVEELIARLWECKGVRNRSLCKFNEFGLEREGEL